MHGGQVDINSPGLDQGSEFVVRLPLSNVQQSAEATTPEVLVSLLPNHRILVVDYNQDAALSLGKLLRLLGAKVSVVYDGFSALETLSTFKPTVMLLDIGMPGYEVASRIRERPVGNDLILIALTGWGQEDDRRKASEAGFDHHLLKPADVGALRDLFASLKSRE